MATGAALALCAASGCSSGQRAPRQADAGGVEVMGAQPKASATVADATIGEARELVDMGREEDALQLLALAIERNPTITDLRLEMGDIHRARGEYAQAEKTYAAAARQDPGSFEAHYYQGLMLHVMERLTESVRAYLRALALRPDDAQANLNLATAYMQLNEPSQALHYAERAAEMDPLQGQGRITLASAYSMLGRHEDAVREYEAASELMDLSSQVLLSMADSQGKIGRYEEMANTLRVLIGMEPSAAAYERLGFALFKMKKLSDAEDAFNRAILADARHYPALNGLGVCLLNRYLMSDRQDVESLRKATDLLRQSLRINRNQPRIVELVGRFG